jgi:hypothetical protein
MQVGYLLSSSFPCQHLLAPDAGPAIADEYDWKCCTLGASNISSFDVLVIDSRHHDRKELIKLASVIAEHPASCIFLRVVDPSIFHKSDYWYQFCREMLDHRRVHFLTPYEPTGLFSYWLSQARHQTFIYAPFTYDRNCEELLNHETRLKLIAVSGNQRLDLYPKRTLVHKFCKIPLSKYFLKIFRLQHPGYPEKAGPPSHQFIGSSYIRWLARHVSAFVDSLIYRVELLKYSEIAYAGCAPVGDLSWSLHECPDSAFIEPKGITDFLQYQLLLSHTQATVEQANLYRIFMRQHRCRVRWRSIVRNRLMDIALR